LSPFAWLRPNTECSRNATSGTITSPCRRSITATSASPNKDHVLVAGVHRDGRTLNLATTTAATTAAAGSCSKVLTTATTATTASYDNSHLLARWSSEETSANFRESDRRVVADRGVGW
jgi:hypothetical protein